MLTTLTDDMTRLCGEIQGMRRMRGSLMNELQRDTRGREKAVADLCAHFGRARATMAERTKHERVAFLDDLNRSVGALRRDMRNDLAGARKVWAGK